MQFISTRGQMTPAPFTEILIDGLASDGGLVVPAEVPTVNAETLESWRSLSYQEIAGEIIGRYVSDIPADDLAELIAAAYSPELFSVPEIVPVTRLNEQLGIVGLSEGPTMAFKDLAMQFLGQSVPYVLGRSDRVMNILGATSGDTGSAAEYAFRGKDNVGVFMLSPLGRMSPVQRAQMYTLADKNIHNLAVDGVFDDCQHLVKEIAGNAEFKAEHSIGAVNSINFGRIVAQMVYYFWAWLRATDIEPEDGRGETRISIAVPSGNFGNLYSGHLARRMGLPIHRLILATNENNVLDEFFRTGIYEPRSRENTLATSSPSMDISKASNLERFIWELLGPEEFGRQWAILEREGRIDLSDQQPRFEREFGIVSDSSTHEDRIETIRTLAEETGVVIDPHTADGVAVARRFADAAGLTLVLETAKPAKFEETVVEALGEKAPALPAEVLELLELPQHAVEVGNDADEVREFIRQHEVR